MNNRAVPVIFGEVLYDCFPDGNTVLGGAPFNVAWHLHAFGMKPLMISSVGEDELGNKVKNAMLDWSMNTTGLQIDAVHPTGSVDIEFDDAGEPHYTIIEDRAYDYINSGSLPQLPETGLLYHGSLSLRNEVSREALSKLKSQHKGTIFVDVNLRDPWWSRQHVIDLVDDGDWVKLNEDELTQLGDNPKDNIESQSRAFLEAHELSGLVVTLGGSGAIAYTADGNYTEVRPSKSFEVVDTVGAGDAFSSVLILGLMSHWPLDQTMSRAQEFASSIVQQQGATVHNLAFYQAIISDWQL